MIASINQMSSLTKVLLTVVLARCAHCSNEQDDGFAAQGPSQGPARPSSQPAPAARSPSPAPENQEEKMLPTCLVCQEEVEDPVAMETCGHQACRDCVTGWVRSKLPPIDHDYTSLVPFVINLQCYGRNGPEPGSRKCDHIIDIYQYGTQNDVQRYEDHLNIMVQEQPVVLSDEEREQLLNKCKCTGSQRRCSCYNGVCTHCRAVKGSGVDAVDTECTGLCSQCRGSGTVGGNPLPPSEFRINTNITPINEIISNLEDELRKFTELKCKLCDGTGREHEWVSIIKPCPNCNIGLERSHACNHMTCRLPNGGGCGCEFCWTCGGPCEGHIEGYTGSFERVGTSTADGCHSSICRYYGQARDGYCEERILPEGGLVPLPWEHQQQEPFLGITPEDLVAELARIRRMGRNRREARERAAATEAEENANDAPDASS